MAKSTKVKNKRVASYEAACKAKGMVPLTLEHFSFLPEDQRQAAFSYHKLLTISEVLNGDWKADWSDRNQYKYYPYFWVDKDSNKVSGFALSYDVCVCVSAGTGLGVRLFYRDADTARYAGETFTEDYSNI